MLEDSFETLNQRIFKNLMKMSHLWDEWRNQSTTQKHPMIRISEKNLKRISQDNKSDAKTFHNRNSMAVGLIQQFSWNQ